MRVTNVRNHVNVTFDSLDDMLDNVPSDTQESYTTGFHGVTSYDTALESARDGEPGEGLQSADIAARRILDRMGNVPTLMPDAVYGTAGSVVDVGRYLSGDPECMLEFPLAEAPSFGRVVNLVIDGTISAAVSADAVRKRGIAIFEAILGLEAAGYTVRVSWQIISSLTMGPHKPTGHAYSRRVAVTLRDIGQPFDPARLFWCLTNVAMVRVFGLNAPALMPAKHCDKYRESRGSTWWSGYIANQAWIPNVWDDTAVHIPGLRSNREAGDDMLGLVLDKMAGKDTGLFLDDAR